MTSHAFWQGIVVGTLAALPLGPMGMLTLRRTLQDGRLAGLVSGAGLTCAVAFWCVISAMGLNRVRDLVSGQETLLMVGLGVFLVTAGVHGLIRGERALRSSPSGVASHGTLVRLFLSSWFGVTLNPVVFLTTTAVLAIVGGIHGSLGVNGLAILALGVVAGGLGAWCFIVQGTMTLKDRLGAAGGLRLSRALNCVILFLGLIYLIRPFIPETFS